ncbi:MAG: transposase, partial [bacterium]|nr:transposase [bacterium]
AELEPKLYAYIGGILRRKDGQMVEIGGVEDHIHLLAGFHQSRSVAGMVGAIKSNSSSFGKAESRNPAFSWQMGYAAFTVSESQVPRVRRYIRNQKEHHRKIGYEDEIRELCRRHRIQLEESFFEDEPES